MIALEVFGQTPMMGDVAERLDALDGVSRLRIEPAVRDQHSLVLATVSHAAADRILNELSRGEATKALGALAVLGTNVAMIIAARRRP